MNRKNIILDTDIGSDCDDAGALAILNLLADQNLCCILGITHCTSNPYGAGTIDVINRYYGRENVDIATYYGEGFLMQENCMLYNRYLTTHFPNRYRDKKPEEAVRMCRRILASQSDKSVEYIGIGPMNNLSNLLNSGADDYSPLSGIDLVRQKVAKLTVMGGIFRGSSERITTRTEEYIGQKIEEVTEWNVGCDIAAARNVAENWPTPKVYVGLEAGLIITGRSLRSVPENHPVRLAYQLHNEEGERFSWDLLTVEYAIVENSPHYKESVPGRVRFDKEGRTLWTPDANGQDHFVELAQPDEKIAEDLNALLIIPPRGGFPKIEREQKGGHK